MISLHDRASIKSQQNRDTMEKCIKKVKGVNSFDASVIRGQYINTV